MTTILNLAVFLGIVALGYLLTMRGIPWVVRTLGRLLGFKMQVTPLTARRIERFRRIRRGYGSFVIVTTAFVLSLFLELYVNNKPLYIRFAGEAFEDANGSGAWDEAEPFEDDDGNGRWDPGEAFEDLDGSGAWDDAEAFDDRNGNSRYDGPRTLYPALAHWVDTWIPFVDLKQQMRAVAEDFGLKGQGEVPYRDYARWARNPAELERDAALIEEEIAADERRFRDRLEMDARRRGQVYDRAEPLPDFKVREYAQRQADADFLRALRPDFEAGQAGILMPLHPYSPQEQLLDLAGSPPHKAPLLRTTLPDALPLVSATTHGEAQTRAASAPEAPSEPASLCETPGATGEPEEDRGPKAAGAIPLLGTDFEGKDVLSQLLYGFRISFAFAVVVAVIGFSVGITVGAIMGYFGGWVDIIVQRVIEVWSSIPFFFTLMILASLMKPSFLLLAGFLVLLRAWLGITYTIRGEFYREKARDYVQAARALGVRRPKIMARHIFPNALVPVVTFMPFAIVAYIGSLVALDFLGFGLPVGTPSWGRLLRQGADNIANYPELVTFPILAFAGTLFCVVMIGEAVREAFDPKLYSRLR